MRRQDAKGYVYLMWDMRLFKIGVSEKPLLRRRQIEYATGQKVHILATRKCDDMFSFENELHLAYHHKRTKGEWFDLSDDEAADVINTLGGFHEEMMPIWNQMVAAYEGAAS